MVCMSNLAVFMAGATCFPEHHDRLSATCTAEPLASQGRSLGWSIEFIWSHAAQSMYLQLRRVKKGCYRVVGQFEFRSTISATARRNSRGSDESTERLAPCTGGSFVRSKARTGQEHAVTQCLTIATLSACGIE